MPGIPVADKDTLNDFYKTSGFGQPNPPAGLVQPSTGAGAEASPAARTISYSHENRGRMGGLSNEEYPRKERITYK